MSSCLGSRQNRQRNIILSHHPPSDIGLKSKKSEVSNSHLEDINTGSKTIKKKVIKAKQENIQSSMQEYQVASNHKTLKDKKNILKQNIQPQNSNQILGQDLTIKEQVLEPFFNPSLKEISKKLWLPTKTDLQDLDLNSLNGSLINSGRSLQAWKMKNTQKG